jgi:hypothetical protein
MKVIALIKNGDIIYVDTRDLNTKYIILNEKNEFAKVK